MITLNCSYCRIDFTQAPAESLKVKCPACISTPLTKNQKVAVLKGRPFFPLYDPKEMR